MSRLVRRRWDPTDHPRNPRNGRFVDKIGGGWVRAAAAQLGGRSTFRTEQATSKFDPGLRRAGMEPGGKYGEANVTQIKPGWAARVLTADGWQWSRVTRAGYDDEPVYIGGKTHQVKKAPYLEVRLEDGQRTHMRFSDANQIIETYQTRGPLDPPDAEQSKRLNQWRRDAQKPARKHKTQREVRIPQLEADLSAAQDRLARDQGSLKFRQEQAETYANRLGFRGKRRRDYIETNTEEARQRVEQAERDLQLAGQTLDYVRTADDPQLTGVNPYEFDYNEDLYNPDRPLAVYGDMLQIGGGRAVLDHLEALDHIPAPMHRAVARYMAKTTYGGIHVGGKSIVEMGFRGEPEGPRGWHHGASWSEVDGVFNPMRGQIWVGYTANTISHNHSAAAHEFGHALDRAVRRDGQNGSETPEWIKIAKDARRDADNMSPYFYQTGQAGDQEMFAEAFSIWASAPKTPEGRYDRASQIVGLMDNLLGAKLGRDKAISVAGRMVDYFDRIAEEVQ